jgi:tetraacyldisaccharide 4'-kinase
MNSGIALIPLSTIYSAVTRMRLAAYRRGWLAVSRLPVPVISVGNLTTGGTGKTPLVEWVCRTLASCAAGYDGKRVCVLTRGYGRDNPKAQVVVSDGTQLLANEREAGDEPLLLARNLLGVAAVIANPNRFAAGEWAVAQLHTEVCVLDDGLQHLRLAREFEIVTIDATNPWGDAGGKMLPWGRLREPRGGLSRADCVVLTRTDQAEELDSIKLAVERLAGPVPILCSRMRTSGIRNLSGDSVAEALLAQPLAAFCGVGNPGSFFKHLRHAGWSFTFTRSFVDHHRYGQSELDELVSEAKQTGARGLITTAKDAVKVAALRVDFPCYVVEIEILFDDEERLARIIRDVTQRKPQPGMRSD